MFISSVDTGDAFKSIIILYSSMLDFLVFTDKKIFGEVKFDFRISNVLSFPNDFTYCSITQEGVLKTKEL